MVDRELFSGKDEKVGPQTFSFFQKNKKVKVQLRFRIKVHGIGGRGVPTVTQKVVQHTVAEYFFRLRARHEDPMAAASCQKSRFLHISANL